MNWGRALTFGLLNFLPALAGNCWLTLLPVVLRQHFGVEDPRLLSYYAGEVFVASYYGVLGGVFLWPFVVRRIDKSSCLLISTVGIGLAAGATGLGRNVGWLIGCRVMQGLVYNVHTVGKDFVFDIFARQQRQIVLTLDSIFSVLGTLVGPLVGLGFYQFTENNFTFSCALVGGLCSMGVACFLFFFRAFEQKSLQEEEKRLTTTEETNSPFLSAVLKAVGSKRKRAVIIFFALSSACCTADLIISVLFLLAPQSEGGLGVNPRLLSMVTCAAFLPCVMVLFSIQRVVPRHVSYAKALLVFVLLFAGSVMVIPLTQNLIAVSGRSELVWVALTAHVLKFCTNSHVFSPFLHYLLNDGLDRSIRTAVNALNYFASVAAAIALVELTVPLYSFALYHPVLRKLAPFNRQLVFWLIAGVQLLPLTQLQRLRGDPA